MTSWSLPTIPGKLGDAMASVCVGAAVEAAVEATRDAGASDGALSCAAADCGGSASVPADSLDALAG